jgi:MFS family permease
MNRLFVLLILTCMESFAAIIFERGIYFYARHHLDFSDTLNLALSLLIGVSYISGAMSSHKLAGRISEKGVLYFTLVVQLVTSLLMMVTTSVPLFFVLNIALAYVFGMKWPVMESYVSAGRDARSTSRVLGYFNMSWAVAVPVAIVSAGYLIDLHQTSLFLVGCGVNLVTMAIAATLQRRPVHLAHDHPDRPPAHELSRYKAMCVSARWNLVSSYTMMFIIAPLSPSIAARLGYESALEGTLLMSILEVMRFTAFTILQSYTRWHGRPSMIAIASTLLPVGLPMVIFGDTTLLVVLGQIIMGLSWGAIYYAAIYYAMVTHNASVDAGGWHEAMIGTGYAIGPAIGLVAQGLRGPLGGTVPAMLTALAPVAVTCYLAGLAPLWKMHRERVKYQA